MRCSRGSKSGKGRRRSVIGLFERILGQQEPSIGEHYFAGMLGELGRGKLTMPQVAAALGLDAGEQAELTALLGRAVYPPESMSLGAYVLLTNIGVTYDLTVPAQGLGLVRLECFGVTGFEFTARWQKTPAGISTLSWQLWNETAGAEVARIDDAAATVAVRTASVNASFAAMTAGVRTFRVRGKSTLATDDPVWLGGSIMVRRPEQLTADRVHEVLLLARKVGSPYNTPAAIRARLGV